MPFASACALILCVKFVTVEVHHAHSHLGVELPIRSYQLMLSHRPLLNPLPLLPPKLLPIHRTLIRIEQLISYRIQVVPSSQLRSWSELPSQLSTISCCSLVLQTQGMLVPNGDRDHSLKISMVGVCVLNVKLNVLSKWWPHILDLVIWSLNSTRQGLLASKEFLCEITVMLSSRTPLIHSTKLTLSHSEAQFTTYIYPRFFCKNLCLQCLSEVLWQKSFIILDVPFDYTYSISTVRKLSFLSLSNQMQL